MNTQAIRLIDGAVGIVVFLLLAVAIIAGQAQSDMPRNGMLSGSAGAIATRDVASQAAQEFSEIVDRLNSMPSDIDHVLNMRQMDAGAASIVSIDE